MPAPTEFERLGGLVSAASNQSKQFLERCSKTKFLAISDYYRASDQYVELAKETLSSKSLGIRTHKTCQECLSDITSALEMGQLDTSFIEALENLKSMYFEDVLKPAFRDYIQEKTAHKPKFEAIYLNALKIDSLIETIQFMNKVQPED